MTVLMRALGLMAVGFWIEDNRRCQLLLLTGAIFIFSDWRPALNLAVLDCAEETNSAVCREFNIAGFPTVRVCEGGATVAWFWPSTQSSVPHFPGTFLGC